MLVYLTVPSQYIYWSLDHSNMHANGINHKHTKKILMRIKVHCDVFLCNAQDHVYIIHNHTKVAILQCCILAHMYIRNINEGKMQMKTKA